MQLSETNEKSDFNSFLTPFNNMVIGNDARYTYSTQFESFDREYWWIPIDHCYARPWNWRPESTFLRPTKSLFMQKPLKKKPPTTTTSAQDVDLIDVENDLEETSCMYDKAKASELMEECEIHAALARMENSDELWEEKVSKLNWSPTQHRLFTGLASILNSEHLSRLANANHTNEPIARRLTIDKSVERARKLLASISWEPKWTQWLHQLMVDHLSTPYLGAYLDLLQSLKAKLPTFVDKMLAGSTTSRGSILGYEGLFPLLRRPWDPAAGSLLQDKPKKLPGNPIIVFVPSTPISSKRILKWINLLSSLTTIVTIPSNYAGAAGHKLPMTSCVEQMFVMTRNKIQDIRLDYPGRNIVLLGFGFGATLALQVAQVEQVLCVVSAGFSLLTAEGRRGELDDNLLELQCPVLFIIGQCSTTSLQEDMEDLRERMRVETGLIVVGSADDNLRVNKKRKLSAGITQSIVDRCIAEEIGEFIGGLILSPYPPQIRQSPTNLSVENATNKKTKNERKRYNSNTSSVDSEPHSPTSRINRPGQNNSISLGRPPGSKSKSKLEAKWAAQGISSSPLPESPISTPIFTSDTSSNDSNLTDKFTPNSEIIVPPPPLKKIKTLKPSIPSPEKNTTKTINIHTTSTTSSAPAKSINLQNRSLSSLLQGDFQSIPGTSKKLSNSGIKVLENVKVSSGGINKKFLANTGKILNLSKISVINPKSTGGNSIVLLPDGKMKNIPQGGKYITSKRQLLGTKPPKPVKKLSYISQALPPPRNLTTQDILDLPIIFADDNQMLEDAAFIHSEAKTSVATPPPPQQPSKLLATTSGSKFVLVNKQSPQNLIISQNASSTKVSTSPATKVPPKYTKIILSSKKVGDESKSANVLSKISNLPSEISIRKVGKMVGTVRKSTAEIDLENEISSCTLYKRKKMDEQEMEGQTPEVMMENLFAKKNG